MVEHFDSRVPRLTSLKGYAFRLGESNLEAFCLLPAHPEVGSAVDYSSPHFSDAVHQLSSLGEIISMCRSDSSMKFEGSLVVMCDMFLALSFDQSLVSLSQDLLG